jgi:hypothetical protein
MEALSITEKSPDSSLADAMNASNISDEVGLSYCLLFMITDRRFLVKMASLSDLVTSLTLTDEGPNVTEQPSKLWSFQASKDLPLPARISNIPFSEVEHSVHAVLQNEQPFFDTSVAPSADASLSPPAPPATPESFPPCSPAAKPWQKSGLPRPDAFSPSGKPVSAWVRKALDIIAKVETEILETEATLFLPDGFDGGDPAQVAQMRVLLDVAAAHVDSAGQSLKPIQRREQEVVNYKQRVINLLKATDTRISVLGTSLPHPPPEATPAFFDASKLLLNAVSSS